MDGTQDRVGQAGQAKLAVKGRLAAHLALQPGQFVVNIPRVVTGQRTAVSGLADLAVGPFRRKLVAIERRLDGEDDDSDDERGDRGLNEEPDDRGDNPERDQYAGRERGRWPGGLHARCPSAARPAA